MHTHTQTNTHTHSLSLSHTHSVLCTISCMHESVWAEINVTNFFSVFSGTFQPSLKSFLKVNHFRRQFQIKWETFDYTHTRSLTHTLSHPLSLTHTHFPSLFLSHSHSHSQHCFSKLLFAFFHAYSDNWKKLQNNMSQRVVAFKQAPKEMRFKQNSWNCNYY